MHGDEIFFTSVIIYVIHLALLSWVIRKSVMADKNKEHDEIMIRLLITIAKKNGTTEEEIKQAVGKKK